MTAHPLPDAPDAESLRPALDAIEAAALTRLEAATDGSSLRDANRHVLGKRSELAQLHTRLRDLPPEQRREVGAWIQSAQARLRERSDSLARAFEEKERHVRFDSERLDLTEFASRSAGRSPGLL